jgi:hypothetical protein
MRYWNERPIGPLNACCKEAVAAAWQDSLTIVANVQQFVLLCYFNVTSMSGFGR